MHLHLRVAAVHFAPAAAPEAAIMFLHHSAAIFGHASEATAAVWCGAAAAAAEEKLLNLTVASGEQWVVSSE